MVFKTFTLKRGTVAEDRPLRCSCDRYAGAKYDKIMASEVLKIQALILSKIGKNHSDGYDYGST